MGEDKAEAVRWYRKAADQGDAQAQFNLGVLYVTGEGVPEDNVLAYVWWNLAAAQDSKRAKKRKEAIKAKMTPAGIAEAQELSREYREAYASDHQSE